VHVPAVTPPALAAWLGAPTVKRPGLHRSRTPEETLALLRPLLWERFGVTRLATVTGLDRIGVPVVMAVRPNSRTLAVSQGKGVDLAAARVSALMESIEMWHAEHHRLPRTMAAWTELTELAGRDVDGGVPDVLDPRALPRSMESLWRPERPLPWVVGDDVVTGRPTWVPYELVHADTRLPQPEGTGCFTRNTNGLASGNTRAEALLHALCELVERDADALFRLDGARHAEGRLDLGTVDDPVAVELLERYDAAGIDVIAWDVTSDVGVATFQVVISDRTADPVFRPTPAAYGAGTHPDRASALVRALTEAAQSRLTHIAGSRDDLTRARYRVIQDPAVLEENAALARQPARRRFHDAPHAAHATVDEDVAHVVAALLRVGVGAVVAVDLSLGDLPIHVVRAVVADLEGAVESPSYRPGTRARTVLQAQAGAPAPAAARPRDAADATDAADAADAGDAGAPGDAPAVADAAASADTEAEAGVGP
jgi:ribosomal protein S12 methylthiotransferase accessory factor